ncbi:p110 11L [African swine fever virus]|uniref:p110 11L n=1 Tax=African swine fever virus TaxID=10497 RepID=A0A894KTU6_ASF|nr:p110 11L [African swine fever virus]
MIIQDWLCYQNQNTQKHMYFHTCTQSYIFADRKCNATSKCKTIYKVQTILPYIVCPILIPPFFHVYAMFIQSTICTFHAMLFTYFMCYFIQTPLGCWCLLCTNVDGCISYYKSYKNLHGCV